MHIMLAQLVGAITGCCLSRSAVSENASGEFGPNWYKLCPENGNVGAENTAPCGPGPFWFTVFFLEMISTMILCLMVIYIKRINGS